MSPATGNRSCSSTDRRHPAVRRTGRQQPPPPSGGRRPRDEATRALASHRPRHSGSRAAGALRAKDHDVRATDEEEGWCTTGRTPRRRDRRPPRGSRTTRRLRRRRPEPQDIRVVGAAHAVHDLAELDERGCPAGGRWLRLERKPGRKHVVLLDPVVGAGVARAAQCVRRRCGHSVGHRAIRRTQRTFECRMNSLSSGRRIVLGTADDVSRFSSQARAQRPPDRTAGQTGLRWALDHAVLQCSLPNRARPRAPRCQATRAAIRSATQSSCRLGDQRRWRTSSWRSTFHSSRWSGNSKRCSRSFSRNLVMAEMRPSARVSTISPAGYAICPPTWVR